MHAPVTREVQLTSSERNPICLSSAKTSTNNHALRRWQNLVPLQIRGKYSVIILLKVKHLVSDGLSLMLVLNPTGIKKKIITDY